MKAAALCALLACAKKDATEQTAITPRVVDAGPAKAPVDHLAPGELVEGTEKVFGLLLPKVMRVDRAFDDVAFVVGPVTPEAVTKYVEAHVAGGTAKRTVEGEIFDKVKARDGTDGKPLRIVVSKEPTGSGTRMVVRDVTPASTANVPQDEEARWRAVGLKPNGEPLDRTKLK